MSLAVPVVNSQHSQRPNQDALGLVLIERASVPPLLGRPLPHALTQTRHVPDRAAAGATDRAVAHQKPERVHGPFHLFLLMKDIKAMVGKS